MDRLGVIFDAETFKNTLEMIWVIFLENLSEYPIFATFFYMLPLHNSGHFPKFQQFKHYIGLFFHVDHDKRMIVNIKRQEKCEKGKKLIFCTFRWPSSGQNYGISFFRTHHLFHQHRLPYL